MSIRDTSGPRPTSALGRLFLESARFAPDRPHVVRACDDGTFETGTLAQSRAHARSIAAMLIERGVKPGEPVAVIGDPSPQQITTVYGIWMAGGVLVPLDPQWQPEAHQRALRKARVAFGVALPGREEALMAAAAEVAGMTALRAVDGSPGGDDIDLPIVDPESRALILFTSGTTGEPKAAVLRHSALSWNAWRLCQTIGLTERDNILSVLPLHHVFGLIAGVISPIVTGARVTLPASLKGPDVSRAMRDAGVTAVPAVPQLIHGLDRAIHAKVKQASWTKRTLFALMKRFVRAMRSLDLNPGPVLFKSIHDALGKDLRVLGSAGAALDPQVAESLWSLGFNPVQGYGLTETGPALAFDRVDDPRFGSVGPPLIGVDLRIREPNAQGIGEIVARSPSLFDGYLDDPEATAEVLRDGWVHTGDLGRLDHEGRLYITGRSKEVIVLGSGKNIYPHEIEVRLEECRFIAESCVVGLADDGRPGTEKLHAILVPDFEVLRREGVSRIEATLADEVVAIGDKLPSHHRIAGITIRTEALPRTALQKLKRFQVLEELIDKQRAGGSSTPDVEEPPPESEHWSAVEAALRQVSDHEGPIRASHGLELDLGLDSLARVEALAALEEKLGVSLPEGFGADALTAGEVLTAVDAFFAAGGKESVGFEAMSTTSPRNELHTIGRRVARPFGQLILLTLVLPGRLLGKLGWKFRVSGVENLPKGAHLICPNHGSYVDAAIILASLPIPKLLRAWSLGDFDIFGNPFMRVIGALGNVIRVDPNAGLKKTLEFGCEVLASGAPFVLFPEGARAPVGERLPFRRGAAILARTANAPIVPTWIEGVDVLLPRGSSKVKFGHQIAVRFGPPIDPTITDDMPDPAQALTDILRERIEDLQAEEREALGGS